MILILIAFLSSPELRPQVGLQAFSIVPPKPLSDSFLSNTVLDEAEVYYQGSAIGLESVVVLSDNEVITGDQSGLLFKITGKQQAENITQLSFPCVPNPFVDIRSKSSCGWPLGMRLDKQGNLLVMDFFGGLVKVDLETGSYESLVPAFHPIEGKIAKVSEDAVASSDGFIYWTDGCTSSDFFEEAFAGPTGRLLRFDPKTGTNQVLLDDLYFANGLAMSEEEDILVISDFFKAGIRRYYLKGEKKGQSDMLIEGLPGYPDNIRSNGKGGFYAALFAPWNEEISFGHEHYTQFPLLRQLILGTRKILTSGLSVAGFFFPNNSFLKSSRNHVAVFSFVFNHFNNFGRTARIVEFSKEGEILNVFNGNKGHISFLSQLSLGEEYGYMASPFNNKVWRIRRDALTNAQAN